MLRQSTAHRAVSFLALTPAERASAFLMIHVLEQEAGVLELLGLGLGLTQGVKADAGDNQDGGTTNGSLALSPRAMMSTVGIRATNSR